MAKKTTVEVNEKQLISDVPAWVLMAKVDTDYAMWRTGALSIGGRIDYDGDIDTEELEDDEDFISFPEYDSTIKALELLKAAGINFDDKTGLWS
jgi:hypothetical protein